MRYDQARLIDALVAEQQNVHVDHAWTPAARCPAAAFALYRFGRAEQLTRTARPLDLDHLIEKARLVRDAPWLGFHDATLTQDPGPPLTQSPARRTEVARTPSKV
jgi:hypothetical protein